MKSLKPSLCVNNENEVPKSKRGLSSCNSVININKNRNEKNSFNFTQFMCNDKIE